MRAGLTPKKRKQPLKGYHSALLLKGGTPLEWIPAGSEIRYSGKYWEVHMPIKNKLIVKKLAKALDAVAYMC